MIDSIMTAFTNPESHIISASHNWINGLNEQINQDLAEKGWSVQPDYFSLLLTQQLKDRLATLEQDNLLAEARIGRFQNNQLAPDIRRDKTYWLERQNETDKTYLLMMEDLRLCINKNLFLGLFEYESHYAVYPENGFYKRHVDALKGGKNRLISTVCYLNEEWDSAHGGQLHLYKEMADTMPFHAIEPIARTLVVFLSEDTPHEVKPATQTRRSIAGWFRCNASSADKVDPLR
jgi:SM-20-related protein